MLGIILAATIPAISLSLILMERATNERLDRTAELMKSQTASFAKMADYFLLQSLAKLKASTTTLDIEDRKASQEMLYQIHRTSPEFLSILLIDTDGRVIAATEFGTKNITGLSVDTDTVQMPLKNEAAWLSGIQPHPGDDTTDTATISIPVNDEATADGADARR